MKSGWSKLNRDSTMGNVFGFVFNSFDGWLSVVLPSINLFVVLFLSIINDAGWRFIPALLVMYFVHFVSFVYMRINRVNGFGVVLNCLNQFVMASIPWVWIFRSGYIDYFLR